MTHIHALFARLKQQNPHPTTELQYDSTFELLVAVILSAQATDKSVNQATRLLFAVANTPQALVQLGEEGIMPYIKTIGLYRNKAKHIVAMSHLLLQNYDGQVPNTREALEALPGVGRKTANVVLNTAFGQPTLAVDTHIFRLANRVGLVSPQEGKNVDTVERALLRVIPEEFLMDAHHWLILHGRYVCTARKPKCGECVIYSYCQYMGKSEFTSTRE